MANDKIIIKRNIIFDSIFTVRGKQVILDADLAGMYQVETKVLNQAVKRNIGRFPEEFRFQLTKEEYDFLRSQSVTLENIKEIALQMQDLADMANSQFIVEVNQIVRAKITDKKTIEHLLDRMLDFCNYDNVLLKFKEFCRYYYTINPQATAEYVNIYRELWDTEEKEENNE